MWNDYAFSAAQLSRNKGGISPPICKQRGGGRLLICHSSSFRTTWRLTAWISKDLTRFSIVNMATKVSHPGCRGREGRGVRAIYQPPRRAWRLLPCAGARARNARLRAMLHDVVIVGAGPVGLFAAFYAGLPVLTDFAAITRPESFAPLPADWHVATCDVRNSTIAVQAGRYKNVNTLGAATITAATNSMPPAIAGLSLLGVCLLGLFGLRYTPW